MIPMYIPSIRLKITFTYVEGHRRVLAVIVDVIALLGCQCHLDPCGGLFDGHPIGMGMVLGLITLVSLFHWLHCRRGPGP